MKLNQSAVFEKEFIKANHNILKNTKQMLLILILTIAFIVK